MQLFFGYERLLCEVLLLSKLRYHIIKYNVDMHFNMNKEYLKYALKKQKIKLKKVFYFIT